jgi:hypothetical protein
MDISPCGKSGTLSNIEPAGRLHPSRAVFGNIDQPAAIEFDQKQEIIELRPESAAGLPSNADDPFFGKDALLCAVYCLDAAGKIHFAQTCFQAETMMIGAAS